MAMEQVTEVGRGLVMESFMCEEENFKLNTGASGGSGGPE